MRRHTKLVDDGRDKALQRGIIRVLFLRPLRHPAHLSEKLVRPAGLRHKRLRPLCHGPLHHLPLADRGYQYRPRPLRHGGQPVQQHKAVKLRKQHIHDDQLRAFPLNDAPRVGAVAGAACHLKIPGSFDHSLQHHTKTLVSVRQYNFHQIFHTLSPLFSIDHARPAHPFYAMALICRYYSKTKSMCMLTVNIRKKPMNSSIFSFSRACRRGAFTVLSSRILANFVESGRIFNKTLY